MSETVTIITSDKKEHKVEKSFALMSNFIKNLLVDTGEGQAIELQCISSETLKKAIEFLTHHKDDPPMSKIQEEEFKTWEFMDDWDIEFFDVDRDVILEWINAANFLDIKLFLLYSIKFLAFTIKGMSTEQMREALGIVNDWPPEQEAQLKEDIEWAKKYLIQNYIYDD